MLGSNWWNFLFRGFELLLGFLNGSWVVNVLVDVSMFLMSRYVLLLTFQLQILDLGFISVDRLLRLMMSLISWLGSYWVAFALMFWKFVTSVIYIHDDVDLSTCC